MIATITSKGQVTIPVKIRKELRLKTGDTLNFVLTADDSISVVPYRTPVKKLRGIVPKPKKPCSLAEMKRVIGCGGSE